MKGQHPACLFVNNFNHMPVRVTTFSILAILFTAPCFFPPQDNAPAGIPGLVVIEAGLPRPAPAWALLERHLIETMDRAGAEFVKTYTRPDGTLIWKERYEGGMNSSDDAYEGFRGFSLHHILGGSKKLDELHRHVWEGITRQFTRYGQIYREFDGNWDWMHHGEGYVSFYPFGLADPTDRKFRERSIRFAAMYIGEDPEAANYDPERKIMRAVMNGSRGPKLEWTKRDWIPTNANLVYYPLPFDDIPGVASPTGWINDHPDDDQFGRIVQVMSDRMAKGDVPINMTAAPLIANAYLYTGEKKYVQWVEDYVGGWIERTKQNNGVTPDNVGLGGKVGEHNGGHWWGGYYGWKWPRGGTDIVLAGLTAAKVARLLSGGDHWFDLPRGQLDVMRGHAKVENGVTLIPIRYDGRNGWHHFVREQPYAAVNLWAASQQERDWKHVERLAEEAMNLAGKNTGRKLADPDLGWAYFVKGKNPDFPLQAFRADLKFIAQKMKRIMNERGDPETWYDAQWLALEPMPTDNLVRLTIGGLPVQKRGEMLHSRLRYFDAETRQPGLPQGVAALVSRMDGNRLEVHLVNTNVFERRSLIVQAGAYAEHRFREVAFQAVKEAQPVDARPANALEGEQRTVTVGGPYVRVDLVPGGGTTLQIEMALYTNQPTYAFPWRGGEAPIQ